MKIVVINGQNHKGSTYHIGNELVKKLNGELTEFFLPKDFGEFCVGCTKCFIESEEKCPHYSKIENITKAIDEADVIILTSPVYVFHATGAMKALLDHYGYRWMIHRPEESMFSKQGVCITTAAGAGMKSTLKDMADSFFSWGVAKRYKYGMAVAATGWDEISEKKKTAIDRKTTKLAKKIIKRVGKVKPGIATRMYFLMISKMQKKGWNEADMEYWKKKGWTENKRPWRK